MSFFFISAQTRYKPNWFFSFQGETSHVSQTPSQYQVSAALRLQYKQGILYLLYCRISKYRLRILIIITLK